MFVRLSGWQTGREIVEKDGKLFFEVAESGHCSICASRISHIHSVVAKKGLAATFANPKDRFPGDAPTLWVGLDKPESVKTDEDIKKYLAEQLDLPIICG